MTSGYTQCACRSCFDIAISDDTKRLAFCLECEEAGCELNETCKREDDYDTPTDETC